jgi:hypothetical protein
MTTYGLVEVQLHQFDVPAALPHGAHEIGGWIGSRASLEVVEKR